MSGTIVQKIPVENDMKQRSYEESEKLSSKVFKVYPLIGDFRPNQKTLDNWFNITRQYIERRLENKSARFHGWVYEQVTLVVVHCAKNWNSFEEGKFSKYVAMQLGYKDENGKWMAVEDTTPVSMNFWGFTPDYFEYSEEYFKEFLSDPKNMENLKAEFFIPLMVNKLINDGTATVQVLDTTSKWFGVTYAADRQSTVDRIQQLVNEGVYPNKLF